MFPNTNIQNSRRNEWRLPPGPAPATASQGAWEAEEPPPCFTLGPAQGLSSRLPIPSPRLQKSSEHILAWA